MGLGNASGERVTTTVTGIPILMYHKIARVDRRSLTAGHYVSPGLFSRQMRLVKALGFETVALTRLFDAQLPKRPLVITFDDGYENFYRNALSLLHQFGMISTVFLVANQLGGTNAWDVALGDVEERLMSIVQIKDAAAKGTDFGSHTMDHAHLATCTAAEARHQIFGSKRKLEANLNLPINTFCYPYGEMTEAVVNLVEEAGYRCACTTGKGIDTSEASRYRLPRVNIRSDTWSPVFLLKLLRAMRNE